MVDFGTLSRPAKAACAVAVRKSMPCPIHTHEPPILAQAIVAQTLARAGSKHPSVPGALLLHCSSAPCSLPEMASPVGPPTALLSASPPPPPPQPPPPSGPPPPSFHLLLVSAARRIRLVRQFHWLVSRPLIPGRPEQRWYSIQIYIRIFIPAKSDLLALRSTSVEYKRLVRQMMVPKSI